MLKRNKPIGKCINLMAKAGIFVENRIRIKGGNGGDHVISISPTVFPFCHSPVTSAQG